MKKAIFKTSVAMAIVAASYLLLNIPSASAAESPEGVVNINTASTVELEQLPGIGAKKAQAIVDYRTKHKFFKPTDLIKVKGIGPKMYEKVKNRIVVQGETTLRAPVKQK